MSSILYFRDWNDWRWITPEMLRTFATRAYSYVIHRSTLTHLTVSFLYADTASRKFVVPRKFMELIRDGVLNGRAA